MRPKLPNAHDAGIGPSNQVTHPDGLVANVEQAVAGQGKRRSFPLELEDDKTVVVTGGEQVEGRMSGEDPESVVFPSEGLDGGPLSHVPDSDRLVFSVRQDKLVSRVEDTGRDIVEVSSTGVDLPSFGVGHPPQLDLTIITARDNQWQGRMERRPIDTTVVLRTIKEG